MKFSKKEWISDIGIALKEERKKNKTKLMKFSKK